jgi:prevent-host-death family protein
MAKTSRAVSLSELKGDPAGVVQRIRSSKRPVRVTENGRTQAILLSVETYERTQRERDLLLALARGEHEIAAGRGFSLDRIFRDADKVLARPQT